MLGRIAVCPVCAHEEPHLRAWRRRLDLEVLEDLEAGIPEKPEPLGNRQGELHAAGVDIDLAPIHPVEIEVGTDELCVGGPGPVVR